ncbi:hypothetical protein BJA5080_01458 [Bradyrhizobium diazoefficiens SEMIA 5080]|uniref:Uncharacterized protein n=1 Tax=Bradyrhizobium diazoefficiens SEMIA 5080 TaxID=754504 RepID=A0A837CE97_9BRAD|nr:hypothetical protein BJA5080_01458 [Bradyrhizobium diazoefficiens SEMIA 5080]
MEVALQSDCPNTACADQSRAVAVAAIVMSVSVMIWLEVRDFDRALARLERILARGYAFPFGIESADLFYRACQRC